MLYYCLRSRKNTENKNTKVVRTKNGRIILLSKRLLCNSRKSKFVTEQEAKGLLSSVGIKAPFSQSLLLGPLLF